MYEPRNLATEMVWYFRCIFSDKFERRNKASWLLFLLQVGAIWTVMTVVEL